MKIKTKMVVKQGRKGVALVQGFALVVNFSQKAWLDRDLQRRCIDLIAEWKRSPVALENLASLEKARLSIEKNEPVPTPYLITRCHVDVMRRDDVPREEWPTLRWWQRSFAQYLPEMG